MPSFVAYILIICECLCCALLFLMYACQRHISNRYKKSFYRQYPDELKFARDYIDKETVKAIKKQKTYLVYGIISVVLLICAVVILYITGNTTLIADYMSLVFCLNLLVSVISPDVFHAIKRVLKRN